MIDKIPYKKKKGDIPSWRMPPFNFDAHRKVYEDTFERIIRARETYNRFEVERRRQEIQRYIISDLELSRMFYNSY